MNIQKFTHQFRNISVLILIFFLASFNAQADKPDKYSFEFLDLGFVADCGDFSVMDDAYIILDNKDFYDKKGNYVRSHLHFTAFDDLYNDAYPDGIHLTGTAHMNALVSFDKNGDPLWTQQGIAIKIIVPGYGPLFLDVGRLVWNDATGDLIFSAGKHHDWNFGEIDALCNYLDQD